MGNLIPMEQPMSSKVLKGIVRDFAEQYPFLQISGIGKSILGKEIPAFVLGKGRKKVLYVGAHHGMEWITCNLLLRFVNEYCEGYRTGGRIEKQPLEMLWKLVSIHVIPMLNPDGVDYAVTGVDHQNPLRNRVIGMNGGSDDFSHWQANARGVDLNHNYNSGFAEYKQLEAKEGIACGAPTRFSGQFPESEPEVRSLCNYIRFHSPFDVVFSFHTQGEELFWKSRGKFLPKSESAIRKIALQCGYQLNEAEGFAAYGGLTDWCIEVCNTPAVTFECGKGVNPLPVSDFSSIYAKIRKTLFLAPTYF